MLKICVTFNRLRSENNKFQVFPNGYSYTAEGRNVSTKLQSPNSEEIENRKIVVNQEVKILTN